MKLLTVLTISLLMSAPAFAGVGMKNSSGKVENCQNNIHGNLRNTNTNLSAASLTSSVLRPGSKNQRPKTINSGDTPGSN